MREYTTKSGRLTLVDAFNGYYITFNDTGETRGAGDGTDWESFSEWVEDVEADEGEYINAYFSH